MPKIGNIVSDCWRDSSPSTKNLRKKICLARQQFQVLPLDKTYVRDTETYRTWSMNAFRRCVVRALAKHGVDFDCTYFNTERGTYCTATLACDDEYKSSTLLVPMGHDMQSSRGWKTTVMKELADGLLQPETEEAEDDGPVSGDAPTGDVSPAWQSNLNAARGKLRAAKTREDAASLLDRASEYITSGLMSPDAMKELRQIAEEKFPVTEGGEKGA